MKIVLILIVSLLPLATSAQDSRIKSWKTLANENGYEFKYPDCWTVRPDNPDETNDPVTKARDLALEETKGCAAPLLYPPQPNFLSFSAGWVKTPAKDKVLKEIENLERRSKNNIERKAWLFFKRFKVGPDEAYVEVNFYKDVHYNWMRWEMTLYCATNVVTFTGPQIKDPDQSYINRFKAGDIALPEPEKTIFESIHCSDSRD